MDSSPQKVIATAGIVTLAVGTLNSLAGKPTAKPPIAPHLPGTRFLIGTGVAFFLLSAMAEAEPDLAKALAIAVTTTVIFGEGDGALSYINGRGEINTQRSPNSTPNLTPAVTPGPANSTAPILPEAHPVSNPSGHYVLTPQQGLV